jgi:hypothetical protein
MAFKREKFKASSVGSMQEQQKEVESKLPSNNNNRAGYVNLQEGVNRLRFYPAHPAQKSDAFLFPKMTHWLHVPVQVEQKDKTFKTEIQKKPIFNSRIHGNTIKDIVEEYIAFAQKIVVEEEMSEEEGKKFLSPITAFGGKYNLKGQLKWVGFADHTFNKKTTFGRIELSTGVKDAMNKIAASSDDAEDVIETDPFTDPDDGRCLLVDYDKQENQKVKDPKKFYSATIDFKKTTPLTDEQLEEFEKQQPLESQLKDCYTRKDFELALEGLRYLDGIEFKELGSENYGFFDDPEFQAIVNEVASYYSDEPSNEEEESPLPKKESTKKAAEKKSDSSDNDDLPFDIPLEEMSRQQLKGVIRREQLSVQVQPSHSEEDLVEMIKIERKIKETQSNEEEEEVEEELSNRTSRRASRGEGRKFVDEDEE